MEPVTGSAVGPVYPPITPVKLDLSGSSSNIRNWTHSCLKLWQLPERGETVQTQISLLLDRSRADTLTAQLITQLRDAIRVGRIAPGVRLPSSRRLSEQLGIGRNTVVRAYEMLEIECYIESRPASGMFATTPPVPRGPVPRRPPDRTGDRTPRIALSGQTLSARTLSAQTLSAQTL